MWLQVGYAYLVSAEIQIRTGHYDLCLDEAKKAIESLQKLSDDKQSSQETLLVQAVSYYYQIRALVEKYDLWDLRLTSDLNVSNPKRFETSIHLAESIYQKALQLNIQLSNPYLEVLLWGNLACLLNINYSNECASNSLNQFPQKGEMMTAFFQWYTTAKNTQFQWQLARFFDWGRFRDEYYTSYGYKIQEITQRSDWYELAYKLFQEVEDPLWSRMIFSFITVTNDYTENITDFIELMNQYLNKPDNVHNYPFDLQILSRYYVKIRDYFWLLIPEIKRIQIKIRQKLLHINQKHNTISPELISCEVLGNDGLRSEFQGDLQE
ncbi:MAG: hypothetical protein KAR20_21200, partial [Candidatus Heimdallarchaeota archaeon]|nr:hypothetical protein [Candidatus Heimdallarchaeota archaeon]